MSSTGGGNSQTSNNTNEPNATRRYSTSSSGANQTSNNNAMDLSGRSLSSSQGTGAANSNAAFTPQHPFAFPSPTTASPQQHHHQLLQQAQAQMQFQQHMQMQQQMQHQQPYHPQQMQRAQPPSQQSSPGFATQPSPSSQHSGTSAGTIMMAPPPSLPPPPLTGSTATASLKAGTATGSKKNTTKPQHTSSSTTLATAKQKLSSTASVAAAPPRAAELLAAAPWADRALWVSRQFLGGNTINGFLRCTTSMKRTKRQRAKQLQHQQKSGANAATVATPSTKDIVVPRVAKKIKTDLEQGMTFCRVLHETIRSLVQEMDPALPPIPPLRTQLPPVVAKSSSVTLSTTKKSLLSSSGSTTSSATTNKLLPIGAGRSGPLSRPLPLQRATAPAPASRSTSSSTTKSNNGTSTLRSRRKHPLPQHKFDPAEIPPNEGLAPEEQTNRSALLLRYRALRQGDVVAARLSSRDLWILARVVQAYPGPPPDFLRLNPARRDNFFRDQTVAVTDVEDDRHKSTTHHIARSHVLPLPRTPVEASAWARAFLAPPRKQQSNPITVYAMYPATTSLYTASVVDSTTYCHGDDDIIVVQFDGDEPDAITGRVPHRHIPARFVVRVPPENQKKSSSRPTTTAPSSKLASPSQQQQQQLTSAAADALSNLDGLQLGEELPGIDDLDFDLMGGMDD